jgi:hypothetical protein
MFKLNDKLKTININVNNKNLTLKNTKSKLNYSKIKKLKINNSDRLKRDINYEFKSIGIDLLSFILVKCDYKSASDEYKAKLQNTINNYIESNIIK